ncbi:hypothetical protein F4777DRAFT_541245 [Nemania sp. FL0916]|nr:hypothetical protein F4777DRAFT_541245 [Nemania sp. FL0916]
MPSATQPELSMVSPSAKKRRRDDDGEVQIPVPLSSTLETSQNLLSAIHNNDRLILSSNKGSNASLYGLPRKAIPLPVSKKFRLIDETHENLPSYYSHRIDTDTLSSAPSPSQQSQQSYFSHAHPDLASPVRPPVTRANSSALLSPCHICHRKPTKKSDLDCFADCMGCGERTCFVCLRDCQGWLPTSDGDEPNHTTTEPEDPDASFTMQDVDNDEPIPHNDTDKTTDTQRPEQRQKKGEGGWNGRGHRKVICSRCCIERGSEGDVVCLGCLAGMRGA